MFSLQKVSNMQLHFKAMKYWFFLYLLEFISFSDNSVKNTANFSPTCIHKRRVPFLKCSWSRKILSSRHLWLYIYMPFESSMQFCEHGRWNGRRQKTLVRASSFWHIQEFKGLQQEHEFTSFFYASKCFILWCFFVKNILGLCCRFLSYTSVLISKTMLVSLLRTSVSKCDQMINRNENQRCNELFWWKDRDFNLFCFLQIYR